MNLVNQCRPYEKTPGEVQALADAWVDRLLLQLGEGKRVGYGTIRNTYIEILKDFEAKFPRPAQSKVRVGIVGEIFVKFSPLGNNHLEDFLVSEGAETVMAGLLDFLMYTVNTAVTDSRLYGMKKGKGRLMKIAYNFLHKKQLEFIELYRQHSHFIPPTDFENTRAQIKGYISEAVQMGEGWLLTAEMLELIESGVHSVVCTQPFGCLPNHIVGKGMMKTIRENHPGVNLVAIDYDSSASRINQENRLKLMLANANRTLAGTDTEKHHAKDAEKEALYV